MHDIPALFGSMVFNEEAMKERLPQETCHLLKETITQGKPLDLSEFGRKCDAETLNEVTRRIEKAVWGLRDEQKT